MMETLDKRDYFRLDDTIHLAYRLVTKKELLAHEAEFFFSPDPDFHLLQEIQTLELESTEILRNIDDTNRQLGSFLHNLNRRVELISHRLASLGRDREVSARTNTEIGEGGISFSNPELLNVGDLLALKLQFQPSLLGLTCFAEVRDCQLTDTGLQKKSLQKKGLQKKGLQKTALQTHGLQTNGLQTNGLQTNGLQTNEPRAIDGDEYRIGARFMNPDHTTQRLLSRHIIRRQSEERRKRLREENRFDE